MRKIYTALIFLCFLVSIAWGADRFVYCAKESTGDMWFIDTQTIKYDRNFQIASFWTKTIHTKNSLLRKMIEQIKNKKRRKELSRIVYSMEYFNIHLARNLISPMRILYYSQDGQLIHSELNRQIPEWEPIAPNSIGESLLEYFKANLNY